MISNLKKQAVLQYAVQPQVRSRVKRLIYDSGLLSTEPTEEGAKVLDLFHPSYRVKAINQRPLSQLRLSYSNDTPNPDQDIFIDVV